MSNTYNVGEMVKLKSGGPDMTVERLLKDIQGEFNGSYKCQWFAGKKADSNVFPQESLVKVDIKE